MGTFKAVFKNMSFGGEPSFEELEQPTSVPATAFALARDLENKLKKAFVEVEGSTKKPPILIGLKYD